MKKQFKPSGSVTERERHAKWYMARRLELLEAIGQCKCAHCGFDDPRALQIDHVNGGGVQEAKLARHINLYWQRIRENPEQYQVLCANCNWIKRAEMNECLGQRNKATNQLDLFLNGTPSRRSN